jgi:hypothetical protein
MVIEQTVDIPANHRLVIDLPCEVPAGKAYIEVKVIPVVDRQDEGAPRNADEEAMSHVDALLSILSQVGGNIDIDELRTERITAKHLKHIK